MKIRPWTGTDAPRYAYLSVSMYGVTSQPSAVRSSSSALLISPNRSTGLKTTTRRGLDHTLWMAYRNQGPAGLLQPHSWPPRMKGAFPGFASRELRYPALQRARSSASCSASVGPFQEQYLAPSSLGALSACFPEASWHRAYPPL